ncbi:MAG: peptidoglycan DD-metalloendopeptidase family protein [Spirochaetes bacterium]|nr:peptidoglycan DD-metalloendopeptidase family protein [Spirochaetota bacterium]
MKKLKSLNIIILFILIAAVKISAEEFRTLHSISYENSELKNYRDDVRKSIFVIKSRRDVKELPELKFYKYVVKKDDNFWKILSRTSLNMDTVISLNDFDNQSDICEGTEMYLSNMRGVLYKVKKEDTLLSIAAKYEVPFNYILKVNKIIKLDKDYIFIPCADIGKIARSEFIGGSYGRPLDVLTLTSAFGQRKDPFLNRIKFHAGADYRCSVGTKVLAVKSGKVIHSGYYGDYGILIIIDHGKGIKSYYGHLSRSLVKTGDTIERGQTIARSGNTGRSTGPHLHFEIRKDNKPVNPDYYVK